MSVVNLALQLLSLKRNQKEGITCENSLLVLYILICKEVNTRNSSFLLSISTCLIGKKSKLRYIAYGVFYGVILSKFSYRKEEIAYIYTLPKIKEKIILNLLNVLLI